MVVAICEVASVKMAVIHCSHALIFTFLICFPCSIVVKVCDVKSYLSMTKRKD